MEKDASYEVRAIRKQWCRSSFVKEARLLVYMAFLWEKLDSQVYIDLNKLPVFLHLGVYQYQCSQSRTSSSFHSQMRASVQVVLACQWFPLAENLHQARWDIHALLQKHRMHLFWKMQHCCRHVKIIEPCCKVIPQFIHKYRRYRSDWHLQSVVKQSNSNQRRKESDIVHIIVPFTVYKSGAMYFTNIFCYMNELQYEERLETLLFSLFSLWWTTKTEVVFPSYYIL